MSTASLESIETLLQTLTDRLSAVEERLTTIPVQDSEVTPEQEGSPGDIQAVSSGHPQDIDHQGEFNAIRDSVQAIRLPSDLKLNDNRAGIKRVDQPLANVVSKSAKFVETSLKLLSSVDGRQVSQEDIHKLYSVLVAHIRFLQAEQSSYLAHN